MIFGVSEGRRTRFYIDLVYGIVFIIGFGYLVVDVDPRVAAFEGGLVIGYFLRVWENMSMYEQALERAVSREAERQVGVEVEEQVGQSVEAELEEQVGESVQAAVEEQVGDISEQIETEVGEQLEAEMDQVEDQIGEIEKRVEAEHGEADGHAREV